MATKTRTSGDKTRVKQCGIDKPGGGVDLKPDIDLDNEAIPSSDVAESITFWNIDEEPEIIKTNSSMDETDSSVDNNCFKVSEKLADELTSNINPCTQGQTKRSSIENIDSALSDYMPKLSCENKTSNGETNTCTNDRSRQSFADIPKSSSGSEGNDDSDIVEIDIVFDSLTSSEKSHPSAHETLKQTHINFPHSESNELFNFAMSQNISAFGTKDESSSVEPNRTSASWFPNVDDTENIFTKSLILSGITQPQNNVMNKRPGDQDLHESQPKRARIENCSEPYDIPKNKIVKEELTQSENSEFCPPVAIVFPMENDTDKYMFGNKDITASKYDQKRYQSLSHPASNCAPQMFVSRTDGNLSDRKLDSREYADKKQINVIKKELECEKVPNAQPLSNFEFDIDFQDSKEDFSIDITPTINQLEGYEEVLAKLMEETKASKEFLTNYASNNTVSQTSFPLKEQITKCVPPNVTYSDALKTSPTFGKLHNPQFPQGIAKNIHNMMTSNTMKPVQYQNSLVLNCVRPMCPPDSKQFNNHNTASGRSDHQIPANTLQSFSLHNDSNLLRKMISTPVTDTNDHSSSNNSVHDGNRNGTEVDSTAAPTNIEKPAINDKGHSDQTTPQTIKPNQPSDKPALSEQVRARITLHHTGAREGEPYSPQEPNSETKLPDTSVVRGTSQPGLPTHLQQPLTVQTNPAYDRGVQDILLQHSLRRKQLSMQHHYGGQGAQPQQFGRQFHPNQFPRAPMMTDNRYALLQRRGSSPFSHLPNHNATSDNLLLKPDVSMMDSGNSPSEYHRAEMIRNGYNPYGKETPGYSFSANRSPEELMFQQRHSASQHPQMSIMQQRMAGMQQSHRHPLLNRQFMNYANFQRHEPTMQGFQRPPSSVSGASNITTNQISAFPGQTTQMNSSNIAYHQQQSFAQQSHAPNMTGQMNTGANFPYENFPKDHTPVQNPTQPDTARMPFMSEYIRQQMARRTMSLPDGKSMMNPIQAGIGPRLSTAPGVAADVMMQNVQQYPPAGQRQQSSYDIQ